VCPQPGHEEVKRRQRERKRDMCGGELLRWRCWWECGGEEVRR